MIYTPSTTRRICGGLALGALLCLASCGGIQNSINPAGPQASNISDVWWLMFIVCSIVFVLVMIAVLLALRKRNRESGWTRHPCSSYRRRKSDANATL